MGAGGCREPRRKGTRVAAPSGCIVPWAARASCWPQPQQLLPVSAAGSGRRCCTGAFLPAGLFGGSMLFESTLAAPFARQIKQKLRYPLDAGVLGGRGWIARAAHLKKPRRGFFTRRTIRRVDAVRIHPCSPFCKADKTETPVPIGCRSSWWARVDCASRASKKAPQGLFYPPDYSAGRCCSNPPLHPLFSKLIKQKLRYPLDTGVLGGAKQPKSEPLPSEASLAAISSKVMVFVPSL